MIFANIFKVQFLRCLRLKKNPKIVTGPLNEFGILLICLCPIVYVIRLSIRLLVKLRFGYFEVFIGFVHF